MIDRIKRMILPDVEFRKEFISFMCLFSFFQGALVFSSLFINLFLLSGSDMSHICVYNGVIWAVQPFAYFLSGYWGKKTNMPLQIRISMISLSFAYLILILLGKRASDYAVLLGVFTGIANGFYYLPHSCLINELNDRTTVDAGLNILSLIGSVEGILIPLISGFIVTLMPGISGYLTVFCFSFILMMCAFMISFRLPKTKSTAKYNIIPPLKRYMTEKSWRTMLGIDVLRAFREGGLAFIISILMFLCVPNELFVSFNSTICSVVTILAMSIVLKRLNADNRLRYYNYNALGIFLVSCILFFNQGVFVLFLFSLVNAVGGSITANSSTAMEFDVFNQWNSIIEYRSETFALREMLICYSRVVMMAILFFMEQKGMKSVSLVALYIVGICFVQCLMIYLLKLLQKEMLEE